MDLIEPVKTSLAALDAMPEPTPEEQSYAETLRTIARNSIAIDGIDETAAVIAHGLAYRRHRLLRLVADLLPPLPRMSREALESMKRGWTPEQVRALIADHETIRTQLEQAHDLMRRMRAE